MGNEKEKIDFAGHLDTLERRASHLSGLVYPDPGARPQRAAHWRDEIELKALRAAIPALREKRDRETKDDATSKLLFDTLEMLETLEDDDTVRRLVKRIEEAVGERS